MTDQNAAVVREPATPNEIERARDDHEVVGEIEIDDDALVSRTPGGGTWVQAWVWIQNEDGEDATAPSALDLIRGEGGAS